MFGLSEEIQNLLEIILYPILIHVSAILRTTLSMKLNESNFKNKISSRFTVGYEWSWQRYGDIWVFQGKKKG